MIVFQSKPNPNAKWIDARFYLMDVEEGKRRYDEEHIAGAIYWDVERHLSDMTSDLGRHPLPSKEAFTTLYRESGLELDDEIVIYDDAISGGASRAYWSLRYGGFQNVVIARESFEQLKELGYETTNESVVVTPSHVSPSFDESILAMTEDVERVVAKEERATLIDARAHDRYLGVREPIDPVKGRIPSALSFDWERLIDHETGQFSLEQEEEFLKLVSKEEPIIVYCGSGVSAAPLFAMLTHYGFTNVRLYAGSFSCWIRGDRPIATGEWSERE